MSSPAPAQRLGPYELIAPIGKGGMGEVWRARDTRLGRDVAIKTSAQQFTDRFEREARAIAALNHPNICTLHDVGPNYLVMELIEGPTLADRIKEGAIPFDEALNIARQIADALDAAHEKGIVHRDLKPANIKLRSDGSVKVLDFGLAKPAVEESPVTSDSPTLLSVSGMILGTAGYMSPEQAKGRPVDKRADIFAFGVVLYEMVAGQRLFQGETISESLASVIKDDPDWTKAPARVQRLLRKYLEKDPKKRLRDIGDWQDYLEEDRTPVIAQAESKKPWAWMAACGVAVLAAAGLGAMHFGETRAVIAPLHVTVPLPDGKLPAFMALSPDGRMLALNAADKSGQADLGVRALDSDQIRILPNTGSVRAPFWSPDGKSIAYSQSLKLKVVSAAGGPPQELCDAVGEGGTWNRDGVILIAGPKRKLVRVNASAGGCTALPSDPAIDQDYPFFLPDGKHLLFAGTSAAPDSVAASKTGIYLASLDNPKGARILPDESSAIYAPGSDGRGYLLFRRDGALVGQRFDPGTLKLSGDVFRIADEVALNSSRKMMATAGPDGLLLYATGRNPDAQLTWLDRSGKTLSTVGPLTDQRAVALSPDGSQIAIARGPDAGLDIWLQDASRNSESRLTNSQVGGHVAVWSPDGRMLAFTGRDGNLYRKGTAGGTEELLLKTPNRKYPSDWSRDGRFLLYTENDAKTKADIWVLPNPGGPPGQGKAFPFQLTEASETQAQFSPDGRWIAYVSNESGKDEIYVRPFPSGGGRWKVSRGEAREPRWRGDGKEIYFLAGGRGVAAVPVTSGANGQFSAGEPKPLFEQTIRGYVPQFNQFSYSPAADGQRFLMLTRPEVQQTIHLLTNWTQVIGGKK